MSTKCIACEKVCSYRTEDYVPEYASILARVMRLEEALKDAERVLEWAEPQPRPVLIRVRRALEEK